MHKSRLQSSRLKSSPLCKLATWNLPCRKQPMCRYETNTSMPRSHMRQESLWDRMARCRDTFLDCPFRSLIPATHRPDSNSAGTFVTVSARTSHKVGEQLLS